MDSAVRFLWKRPFRDLTVAELMAGTSLSRPAFYQYFANLHELIESLFGDLEILLHDTADPWINGEGEPIADLRKSLGGIVQTCVEHGRRVRLGSGLGVGIRAVRVARLASVLGGDVIGHRGAVLRVGLGPLLHR